MIFRKLLFIILISLSTNAISQIKDSSVVLNAYKLGFYIDPITKEKKEMALCGDFISTDTMKFFTVISGCERNVGAIIGKYTLKSDTLHIEPFDFNLEPPFLKIVKKLSTNPRQSIQFLTIDNQLIKGIDSSWLIRCFRGRKSDTKDFTGIGIVDVDRYKYDGIEILQLSKIFHVPIVLFLNPKFDYVINVNQPIETLNKFILGCGTLKEVFYFNSKTGCFKGCVDSFKVEKVEKY